MEKAKAKVCLTFQGEKKSFRILGLTKEQIEKSFNGISLKELQDEEGTVVSISETALIPGESYNIIENEAPPPPPPNQGGPEWFQICNNHGTIRFCTIVVPNFGPLKILDFLAFGSSGKVNVYLGKNVDTGNRVVVKLGFKGQCNFQNECRILQMLSGVDNVQQLILCGNDSDNLLNLLVTTPSGIDLDSLLSRNGPFSMEETREIASEMLNVLKCIHAHGILHRDIKPANIIWANRESKYCLIDFGLACHSTDANEWKMKRVGTPLFFPLYVGEYSPAEDLQSLFYTLVVLYLGFAPWDLGNATFASQIELEKINFYNKHKDIIKSLQEYKVEESLLNVLCKLKMEMKSR